MEVFGSKEVAGTPLVAVGTAQFQAMRLLWVTSPRKL